MPENELIIKYKGEEYDFELTERDADHISDLTGVIECAPFDQRPDWLAPGSQISEDRRENRRARNEQYEQAAGDFQVQLKRLAALDRNKMALLIAFLDIIDLGHIDGSESNWILEFIEELLHDVIFEGPAGALHQDPRPRFASLAHYMFNYWSWVRDSRKLAERHPALFPALHAPPEAAAEPTPAVKPRRAPATRKRGRKQAA